MKDLNELEISNKLDQLNKEELEFVQTVILNPGCKMKKVLSSIIPENESYALFSKPENLGLIYPVGLYKWKAYKKTVLYFNSKRAMNKEQKSEVLQKFSNLINQQSLENESNTPDFILGNFLFTCMNAFNNAVNVRDEYNAPNFDLVQLEKERLEWSYRTFPEATPISCLKHLRKEIDEIEQNIKDGELDAMEYADALMLLLDSAGRRGISVSMVLEAYAEKQKINKSREWVKNPDNSYYHVKECKNCKQIREADAMLLNKKP